MSARAAALAAALALLALTGCSGGSVTAPSDEASTPQRPPFTTLSPSPTTPPGTPTSVPDARWAAIVQDLTDRGVAAAPTLVSAEAVTWRNGALGCPQPGAMYTQALVNGMRVVVEAGGAQYDYRFGTTDTPVLCTGTGTPAG
ncbi:hypothetical protein ET475_02480 [Microbacterium protaetiae]|uniref:Uncharacterized protein n=1 Tax=Microbacterium protaetiae TaxID=2509458 RepID=A0A4P6EA16_9MICO|nr:hypothetical protein [Microbacterium protaetiae]QAY58972.1 hypothetical protein ET475_02480 [Microbacterium protaetiae]